MFEESKKGEKVKAHTAVFVCRSVVSFQNELWARASLLLLLLLDEVFVVPPFAVVSVTLSEEVSLPTVIDHNDCAAKYHRHITIIALGSLRFETRIILLPDQSGLR